MKTIIREYDLNPRSINLVSKYSHPPNPKQEHPHPHKRYNMEYRPFNLINGTPSGTKTFLL